MRTADGRGALRRVAIAGAVLAALALGGCASPAPEPAEPLPTGREGAAFFDEHALVVGDGATRVSLYLDPACPHCATFEAVNGEVLADAVASNSVRYAIHPLTFMDRSSQTDYSSRASSALSCVAVNDEASLLSFLDVLMENQPSNADGLSDEQLADLAAGAGARNSAECIAAQPYIEWVRQGTELALEGPIPGAEIESIEGTPTLLVDGVRYPGAIDDRAAVRAFIGAG